MNIIFVVARTRDDDDVFNKYVGASLQSIQSQCVNVVDSEESDSPKYISTKYNIGVNVIKKENLLTDDTIVVFSQTGTYVHDDLFRQKLDVVFDNPNIGVVGIVGSKTLNPDVDMYDDSNNPVNSIIVVSEDDSDSGTRIVFSPSGFYDSIVAVDDAIFAVRGSIFNTGVEFTENMNFGYGLDISQKSISVGYDVVCADINIVAKLDNNIITSDILKLSELLDFELPLVYNVISNHIVDVEI